MSTPKFHQNVNNPPLGIMSQRPERIKSVPRRSPGPIQPRALQANNMSASAAAAPPKSGQNTTGISSFDVVTGSQKRRQGTWKINSRILYRNSDSLPQRRSYSSTDAEDCGTGTTHLEVDRLIEEIFNFSACSVYRFHSWQGQRSSTKPLVADWYHPYVPC